MTTDDFITTEEAGQRLQRSTEYVLQLRKRGKLTGKRIGPDSRGGQWLISAASVELLLEEWATNPPRRGRPPVTVESILAKANISLTPTTPAAEGPEASGISS